MADFDKKKKDTIKHDQHTDRKNTPTVFFLKNSRVLLYLFFSQKQSCFVVSFLGSKMSVKRSLQNFWVLGIGTLGIASIPSVYIKHIYCIFFEVAKTSK